MSQSATKKTKSAGSRKLVIIDGANTIYRAFFAIPNLRAPDGTPTNAALGFTNILTKVLREEEPDYVAVAFDPRGKTFRHGLYGAYKAGRDAQPEDLTKQFPLVRELLEAQGIRILEVADFEADDVIATLVALAPEDVEVTIISTDKDLMQLVSPRVVLADGMKDRRYGPAEVEERFGVPPERMLDLRSLVGDPSDNIPGVKGIGEKGAAKLIAEWETLENLLAHVGEVTAKRARTALEEHADEAVLSKQLATLRADVPLPVPFEELACTQPRFDDLRSIFERLGFTRQLAALDGEAKQPAAARGGSGVKLELVETAAALRAGLKALDAASPVALHVVLGAGNAVDAAWVGLALSQGGARALYVPLAAGKEAGGLAAAAVGGALQERFGPGVAKSPDWFATGVKPFLEALANCDIELAPPSFDVELAAFLVDPAGPRNLSAIALQFGAGDVPTWEDLAGRGAKQVAAEELAQDVLADWAARQACAASDLRPLLVERLEADGLSPLFRRSRDCRLHRVLVRDGARWSSNRRSGKLAALSERIRGRTRTPRSRDPPAGGREVPGEFAEATPGDSIRET